MIIIGKKVLRRSHCIFRKYITTITNNNRITKKNKKVIFSYPVVNINNQYNTSNLFINERSLWTFGTEKPKYKKTMSGKKDFPVVKSELDWQKELSPDEYYSNDNLLTVFYDGGCSLCTKEINHYIRLQNKHRGKHREQHLVDFYNIYAEPLHPELERRQISYVDTQKRMHVLTDDGEIIHGFAAFLEIWNRMKYWEYLYLFTKIWPIPIIGEKIYTYWAKRRYDYRKHDIDKDSKCAL